VSDTPRSGPDAGPAMVPLQVILAGGGGMSFDEACEKIFQEFDPPIVCGTYSGVSRKRQETNREQGDASQYQDNESEHLLANSAFQGERGVNSTNIPGASKYTEGTAFAYSVFDGQGRGTEHKFLTDAARNYEKGLTKNPTLGERLAAAKQWTKDSLLSDKVQRTKDGQPRSRVKDAKNRSPKECEDLAEAAAECLTKKAAKQFEKKKISQETETRRGLAGGDAPEAPVIPGGGESAL
jgi:hypothetical protein